MRYEIMVGRGSTANQSGDAVAPSRFQKLKSIVLVFLSLSAIVGILLASFLVGIMVAGLILLALVVAIGAWLVSRLWRRS